MCQTCAIQNPRRPTGLLPTLSNEEQLVADEMRADFADRFGVTPENTPELDLVIAQKIMKHRGTSLAAQTIEIS